MYNQVFRCVTQEVSKNLLNVNVVCDVLLN